MDPTHLNSMTILKSAPKCKYAMVDLHRLQVVITNCFLPKVMRPQ